MDEKFLRLANKNRVGAVGLVETDFGFHVIKVTDKQDLVLLASVSRAIVPSDKHQIAFLKTPPNLRWMLKERF